MTTPGKPTRLTHGMARKLQAARNRAANRERIVSLLVARTIRQIEDHLKEEAAR